MRSIEDELDVLFATFPPTFHPSLHIDENKLITFLKPCDMHARHDKNSDDPIPIYFEFKSNPNTDATFLFFFVYLVEARMRANTQRTARGA